MGTFAPHANVDTSHAHWLLLQAPVVPAYLLQSTQLDPQWAASLFA